MKSITFLNKSQATLVKQTWPIIVSNNFWTLFYVNLFKKSPSYQLYFDRFANVPIEALQSNVHFKAHTARTAFAFNSAVELLEAPEELRQSLKDLGEKHRKYDLTVEHFEIVKVVLTDLIEDRLKDVAAGEPSSDAWRLCVAMVIGVIKDSAATRE